MQMVRRWFLLGGAVLSIIVGFVLGIAFMMNTINIFNVAIETAGSDGVLLITNLAHGIKGILAWIVFGLTMTNALIIASTLSLVIMVGPKQN
jgi:hypothetical protein